MRSHLRSLAGLLTARQWWGALGLVLLLVLLWSAGVGLGWPLTVPLAGTVLLLSAGLAALLADRFRGARTAEALERSIRGQAHDQLFGVRPGQREQIAQVEREFAAAVHALKQSKVGKGHPGRSALYALPWYVVIGPPAAGKTTAITESGLDFPIGPNRVRGIGGTRHCDWFFSTSAILLDTAGRYMTVEEDLDEWRAFLGLLKRHRPRTPVNGVLVVVSMEEVLHAAPEELPQLAADLRHRIDELITELGVRFPLYLVFTKCDLVRGFAEFFGDLDPEARGQVWGCTLPRRGAQDESARRRFEREFDLLSRVLVERRAARLAAVAAQTEAAREVYLFPLEFASVRAPLATFVEQLLHPNPYADAPDFRGFYFTSALQGGAAFDRILPAIAEQYALPPSDGDRGSVPAQSRSHFLGTLFRDVIIRDRGLVTTSARAAGRRERTRRGAIAAAVLGLAGFGWLAGAAYAGSASDLRVARRAVEATARHPDRESLDSLERAITLLEGRAKTGSQLRRLGLDRSGRVLPVLHGVFARRAAPILVRPLIPPLEGRLRGYAAATPDLRAGAYNDLRAYLLLGPDAPRLRASAVEREFLRSYFHQVLEGRPADTVYTNRLVDALDGPVLRVDSQLVERTRGLLYTPPTLDGLYQGLRDEGARRLPPVPIAQLLGPAAAVPFDRTSSVPGLYTKAAWENFVQGAIERRSREPGRTDWVVGSRPDHLPPELADPDSVAGALLQRYFTDYIAAWRGFLTGIRYTTGGAGAAPQTFLALGDAAKSPLVVLLDSVGAQTRFENAAVAGTRQKLSDFAAAALRKFGYVRAEGSGGGPRNPVDRTFAPLHALRESGQAAALAQILAQYAGFGQTMQALAAQAGSASAATQLATEAARARAVIGQAAQGVDPAIRAAVFERPFEIAGTAASDAVAAAVNAKWHDQVCEPFRAALAGRYPFASRGPDAAPAEVERFFQPQAGTIWAFYDRELSSLLSPRDFQPLPGRGGGVRVDPAAVGVLRRAKRIRDGLFAGAGGMRVDFGLTPQPLTIEAPPGRSPVATEVCLTIDGQPACYRNGAPGAQSFVWPSRAGQPTNAITVTVNEPKRPPVTVRLDAPGDWGWLRLLDRARVSPVNGSEYRVAWSLPHESGFTVRVVYTLVVKGSVNPFVDRGAVFAPVDCPPIAR